MAGPNIDLLGAVYPTVSGIELPKQGGGTATFPWVEGSQTVTQNGTFDVTTLAQLIVNVSGSTIEMESGTITPSSNPSTLNISFSNTHTNPPAVAVAGIHGSAGNTSQEVLFLVVDVEKIIGRGFYSNASNFRYGLWWHIYRGTGTGYSTGVGYFTYGSSDPGDSSSAYYRYYASPTGLHLYSGSGQRYWRQNVAVDWKAIWL